MTNRAASGNEPGLRRATFLAMAGTSCMLAHQVAGKAARDGFFLNEFPATDLPRIVIGASILSVCLALGYSRVMAKVEPWKIVPAAFAASGLLHLAEWHANDGAPAIIAVLIYLHLVGLGAVLLSGFWLLLSELFDPREAKRTFGRIAAAGTGGGIAGGLLAERFVAWWGTESLLFLLAGLHLTCAVIAGALGKPAHTGRVAEDPVSPIQIFKRTPLLWFLGTLVLLTTSTAALLDYLFKSGAAATMGRGAELVRYFAIYYTVCQVLTVLVQTLVLRRVLAALGVARTVAALPLSVGVGSLAGLLVPALPLVIGVRALEVILRGSLFRSAYELLYTPLPPREKRAVKTTIDVGCDRTGDAVGAGVVQAIVSLGPSLAHAQILGVAVILSGICTWIAVRIGRAYREVLELGLVKQAQLSPDFEQEPINIGESLVGTLFTSLPALPAAPGAMREASEVPAHAPKDTLLSRLEELRSADAQRVVAVLRTNEPFALLLTGQVIQLLAWDAVSQAARDYLERGGSRIAGQLIDCLLAEDTDFTLRRRIPRLLAKTGEQRAASALLDALRDSRFEVRFQCGRALEYMRRHNPALTFDSTLVYEAVNRELAVNKTIWQSRRLLDQRQDDEATEFLDDLLRERADHNLEHVFSLLALLLPREPLMAAFRGLHDKDKTFRGLALEYLETALPADVTDRLLHILEERPTVATPLDLAEQQALMQSLLTTNARMELRRKQQSGPS